MLDGSKARGYTLLFAGAVLWLINPERAGFGILDGGMLVTGIGLISGSDRSVAQLASLPR